MNGKKEKKKKKKTLCVTQIIGDIKHIIIYYIELVVFFSNGLFKYSPCVAHSGK